MAVIESVGANTTVEAGGLISPSPPSSVTSQESGVSSNNDHGGNGIHGEIGVHVARSDGGESFKRDLRELHELLSKLNPMAEEFVPPSLTKPVVNGFNGGFFAVNNGFGAAGNFPVNEDGGFRRVRTRLLYLLCDLYLVLCLLLCVYEMKNLTFLCLQWNFYCSAF